VIEPVLIAIANSLAAKAAAGLYDLVRKKFETSRSETAALEAAEGADEGSREIAVLAEALERAESADGEFKSQLRAEWARISHTERSGDGHAVNDISGTVSGNIVQARDIQGGITF